MDARRGGGKTPVQCWLSITPEEEEEEEEDIQRRSSGCSE
jgi:hypothetical protein